MLPVGHRLVTERGTEIRVAGLFGYGGQGEVYRVTSDKGERALKWYYPHVVADGRQRAILEGLVSRRPAGTGFLWPQALVSDPVTKGFGYLMNVRPQRFSDLPALFRRDVKVSSRTLVTVALRTASEYRVLHSMGVAYRDINWGNLFFDPITGEVLICDNDNAVPDGEPAMILGTTDFMAPELVRSDPGKNPSIQTDLHALAVLIFMVLMNHHPLEGEESLRIRCMDEAAKRKLFGAQPVFIYDPDNDSNRPVAGEQDTVIATWKALPKSLQSLFEKAFTAGLHNPSARIRETEWCDALSEVHGAAVTCPVCGKQNLSDPGPAAMLPECWKCGSDVPLPARFVLSVDGRGRSPVKRSIRITPGAQVFAHHLVEDAQHYDFSAASTVGEVTAHPQRPDTFGLTNRSAQTWTAYREEDGDAKPVPPGGTAALRPGLLIEFGDGAEGVFRSP
jgi:DNA-binding helix-hairpin-helix protein with protein kinase domain